MVSSVDIVTYLELFFYAVELRTFSNRATIYGYYDDWDKLARAIEYLENESGQARIDGRKINPLPDAIYTTLNPFNRDLVARSFNTLKWGGKDDGTKDKDIIRRCWLPIDCDAIRARGISSTDAQHDKALSTAKDIRGYLTDMGFPDGLAGDSGNGAHCLYRLDLPSDNETRDLIKAFLQALAGRFNTPAVSIDEKVFNASRIWKCYGTWVKKGSEIDGRKHRQAHILELPSPLEIVDRGLIEKVMGDLKPKETAYSVPSNGQAKNGTAGQGADFGTLGAGNGAILPDWLQGERTSAGGCPQKSIEYVENFIQRHEIGINGEGEDYEDGKKWHVDTCPLCGETDKSAVLMVRGGHIAYACQHNRCQGKGWKDFKAFLSWFSVKWNSDRAG